MFRYYRSGCFFSGFLVVNRAKVMRWPGPEGRDLRAYEDIKICQIYRWGIKYLVFLLEDLFSRNYDGETGFSTTWIFCLFVFGRAFCFLYDDIFLCVDFIIWIFPIFFWLRYRWNRGREDFYHRPNLLQEQNVKKFIKKKFKNFVKYQKKNLWSKFQNFNTLYIFPYSKLFLFYQF